MIVSELIEKLEEMPQNAEVYYLVYEHDNRGVLLGTKKHQMNRVWDFKGIQVALDYVK